MADVMTDNLRDTFKRLLDAQDFSGIKTQLQSLTARYRATPFDGVQVMLSEACGALGDATPETLERWRAEHPDDVLVWLVSGLALNRLAIKIRGEGGANEVSGDQWKKIQQYYKEAKVWLERVLNEPSGAWPVGMALGALMTQEQICGSRTRAEKYFEILVRRDPHWLDAWRQIQGVREPRWGGSVEEMESLLAQARRCLPEEVCRDLTATHEWWRGSYALHFEEAPEVALKHFDEALALAERPRQRAQIHEYRAYALDALDRTSDLIAAWQSAAVDDPVEAEYRCRLGWALEEKAKRLPEAIESFRKGADLEGEFAYKCAYRLGHIFEDDDEASRLKLLDARQSLYWFERAVTLATNDEQRNESANMVGWLTMFGDETVRDIAKAERCFREATGRGSPYSAHQLAELLQQRGDTEEAFAFYCKAAEQGYKKSIDIVAQRIHEMDDAEAERWLATTAASGHSESSIALAARRLQQGNAHEAEMILWHAAANPDNIRAIGVLGRALLEGSLGKKDARRAADLLEVALGSSNNEAEHFADLFLTFYVASYEALEHKSSWVVHKAFLKGFKKIRKFYFGRKAQASDEEGREYRTLLGRLPSWRLTWWLRKMFGRPIEFRRLTPFTTLEAKAVVEEAFQRGMV